MKDGNYDANKVLNAYFPDTHSSCYVEKPLFEFGLEGGVTLSIIIPVFNTAQYLERCIQSVLGQSTRFEYEVIIINDGSNDGSKEILEQYKHERGIRLIHQKNEGFSGARNKGINLARGAYLMFVDSDDCLLEGAVDKLLHCAVLNDAEVVAGSYIEAGENGKVKRRHTYNCGETTAEGILHGEPWAKVYRRDLFTHLRFPRGYWYEDTIFAQVVWPTVKKCFTISDMVYVYLINPNGVTHRGVYHKKAVDSLYITRQLLKDRVMFGLNSDQMNYRHFLRMVFLTYARTRAISRKNEDLRKAIFEIQRELKDEYFCDFRVKRGVWQKMAEAALQTNCYCIYVICCESHRVYSRLSRLKQKLRTKLEER